MDMDDAKLARHRYDYDPETGEFLWANPPPKAPKSKAAIGTPAGTVDKRDGNRQLNLDGKIHPASRLAWLISYGEWPASQVCYEDPALPLPTRDRLANLKLSGSNAEVTAESLKRVLSYDADNGVFRWLVSRKGTKAGAVAGGMRKTNEGRAYWYIRVDGIDYPAQRLAWLFVYGEWPQTRLLFKNDRPADFRIENLVESGLEHQTRRNPDRLPDDERRQRLSRVWRKSDLKKNFDLTWDAYQAMHDAQNGQCAICSQEETVVRNGRTRWLAVDHNHNTGAVRDLLCSRCNAGLGNFGDDPARLRAAAAYLERHAAKAAEEGEAA